MIYPYHMRIVVPSVHGMNLWGTQQYAQQLAIIAMCWLKSY